ncbi:MAG TPA: DUF748 domain-containing protein, partial [archaeon]|nr:DUF748 domain-containing protein [archaeon]
MIRYRDLLVRRFKRILLWTVVCLAVFALLGFFVVPPILKSVLTKQLTAALHRDVTIQQVRVNPFALSTTLRGLAVKEANGPETFLSFDELYINAGLSSLYRWGIVVKEFRLTKPFIRLVRHQDQSYNFSDLLEGQKSQAGTPAKPMRFSINNIRIINGGADIQDETVKDNHTIRELNIGIPFLSNIPSDIETFVQPHLSAVINGTRYAIEGKTKPFAESQETTLEVNIAGLDLPYYLAYVPRELSTFALPSGKLDTKLEITFVRQRTGGQTLTVRGDVGLSDLAVADKKGDPIVRIPSLSVGIASVEPLVQKVHLSKITLQSPEITVRREKTGKTNLESLIPTPEKKTSASGPSDSSKELSLDVDKVEVTEGTIRFSDLSNPLPFKATITPIQFSADQLSNAPNKKGTFALNLQTDAKEKVAVNGEVSLEPLQATGTMDVKSIPLKRYVPYTKPLVMFDVLEGTLDVATNFRFSQVKDAMDVKLTGLSSTLRTLRLMTRETPQEFLKIPLLTVKNTSVDLSQREVSVGELSTKDGTALVSRSRDGEINLATLLPRATAAAATLAEAPAPVRPWTVLAGSISVSQYRIQVTDAVPAEPVNVVLDDLSLKAEKLSTALNSKPGKAALAFRLDKGTVSSQGTLDVAPIQGDFQVTVKDIDIRPFQPYIADRVRVTITDGRLSTNGRLQISTKAPEGLQVKFDGETSLNKFAAIEKGTADEVLNWGSLSLQDLSAGYNPLVVHAKKVALADFFAHVIIQPTGRLNLQDILSPQGATTSAEPSRLDPPASPPAQPAKPDTAPSAAPTQTQDVQIEELTLQGGRIQFQDRTLKPSYSATLTEIG